jgi:hypothetical protein
MITLAAILRRLWPYLAIVGLVALSLLLARRVGRVEALVKDYERRIDLQRRMRDAGDSTPTDRQSVIDRLREGDF